jgi:hypothetical protein
MKLKSFCTIKEMVSKLKRLPTEWEKNLCQLYIRQGNNNQNIEGAQKTKLPKNQDPMLKWANELNRALSKVQVQMAKKKKKRKNAHHP